MRTKMTMNLVKVAREAMTQMKMNPTKRSPRRARAVKRRLRVAQVLLLESRSKSASSNDDERYILN
jgi:hypothetical protein